MEWRRFMRLIFLTIFRGMAPLVLASGCAWGTTAYTILVTEPGNQAFSNITLGLDFDVNLPIPGNYTVGSGIGLGSVSSPPALPIGDARYSRGTLLYAQAMTLALAG